ATWWWATSWEAPKPASNPTRTKSCSRCAAAEWCGSRALRNGKSRTGSSTKSAHSGSLCTPPMNPEQLRSYLEFYEDLGIKSLYRREAKAQPQTESASDAPQPPETLLSIVADIGECRRCCLHEQRHKI